MKIAIMGSGGVGGYFGGMLAAAREDVFFVARGAHLERLKQQGLTLKTVHGNHQLRVQATDQPKEIGRVDLVLFCVKTYDTDEALKAIVPLVGIDTLILPLQNGIDAVQQIGAYHGLNHMLGGAAYIFSTLESPGVVSQTGGSRKIVFGELDGHLTPRGQAVKKVFDQAQIPNELTSHVKRAIWEKFVMLAATSGMSALTRVSLGEILACSETRAMLLAAMQENFAVGCAEGVDLDAGLVACIEQYLETLEPSGRASMYYDLMHGRRLELESLAGTVVRLGKKHAIPTPVNAAIYAALKPHERKTS